MVWIMSAPIRLGTKRYYNPAPKDCAFLLDFELPRYQGNDNQLRLKDGKMMIVADSADSKRYGYTYGFGEDTAIITDFQATYTAKVYVDIKAPAGDVWGVTFDAWTINPSAYTIAGLAFGAKPNTIRTTFPLTITLSPTVQTFNITGTCANAADSPMFYIYNSAMGNQIFYKNLKLYCITSGGTSAYTEGFIANRGGLTITDWSKSGCSPVLYAGDNLHPNIVMSQLTSGVNKWVMRFNGTNSRIFLPRELSTIHMATDTASSTRAFSLEGWFLGETSTATGSVHPNNTIIFSANESSTKYGPALRGTSTGNIRMEISTTGADTKLVQTGGRTLTGCWYHVVGVFDGTYGVAPAAGTSGMGRIYINGSLCVGSSSSAFCRLAPDASIKLAHDFNGGYSKLTLGKVAIYNTQLTEAEIGRIYINEVGYYTKNLMTKHMSKCDLLTNTYDGFITSPLTSGTGSIETTGGATFDGGAHWYKYIANVTHNVSIYTELACMYIPPSQQFTISAYLKGAITNVVADLTLRARVYNLATNASSSFDLAIPKVNIGADWTRFSETFTSPSFANTVTFQIIGTVDATDWIGIDCIQLELGAAATAWEEAHYGY
jgi:hypothetical protein